MEPWMWPQMLWTVGFLCVTYLPLQCVALWKCRGVARVAAALPILVMIPMLYGAVQPLNYDDGSLFGMYFVCPYLPAMIYLVAVSLAGPRLPKVCPHCGHKQRVKSFELTRSTSGCKACGKDLLEHAATGPNSAPGGSL
ncbi:MAG: hypothetical protein SH850_13670 [Planctomycetaceae bacterium]|nr:hypothetical protein [Planctomycetaceae bacterium]